MHSNATVFSLLIEERKKETVIFLLLSVLLTGLQAPIPYLTGYLVDAVLPLKQSGPLIRIALFMAALYAGFLVVSYANELFRLRVRRDIMVDLHQRAIKGILRLTHNQRLTIHDGDLVSRLTRDITQLDVIMPYGWSNLVHQILLSVVLLTVVFILNWQLTSLLLVLIPFAVVIYMRFDRALWDSSEAETLASGAKLAVIEETIEADAEVKAYEAEQFFLAHSAKAIKDFEGKSLIRELLDAKVSIIITGMPMLAVVLIWYVGGTKVMNEEITLGLIITYTSTLTLMVPALIDIVEFVSSRPNEVTALKRVAQICEFPKDSETPKGFGTPEAVQENPSETPVPKPPTVEALSLESVSFSYTPVQPLFKKLTLRFRKGEAYLINGGNGSGKSTLLSILSGGLKPLEGRVLLDDQDLSSLAHRAPWITYVPQRIRIISETIRNNVTFGTEHTSDQVEAVLRRVGLGEWIDRLDDGIDHRIANANTDLSGGQIQKIGLARALLRDTPVLLMDEPTNNLDSLAVQALIETVRDHKRDRIIIIVSHDDRTFGAVDHVIYLENSSAAESTQVAQRRPTEP